MAHPHMVRRPDKGYLLTNGEYGGCYDDNLALFPTPEKAKKKAVALTAETGEPHYHECYRFKIQENERHFEKSRKRNAKDFRRMPYAHVPLNRVFRPFNEPSLDDIDFMSANSMLDITKPVTVLFLALKGTSVMGIIYEQDGEINGLDDYPYEVFERIYRSDDYIEQQKALKQIAAEDAERNGHVNGEPQKRRTRKTKD